MFNPTKSPIQNTPTYMIATTNNKTKISTVQKIAYKEMIKLLVQTFSPTMTSNSLTKITVKYHLLSIPHSKTANTEHLSLYLTMHDNN
jgi:hypothetical protein